MAITGLDRMGVPYSLFDAGAQGVIQIFVRDPHNVMLELNFNVE